MSSSKTFLQLFLFTLCCTLFAACGGEDTVNYREKIIGEWELKNEGELQAHFKNKAFVLKKATMKFDENGVLETKMLSSRDKKTWLVQTGTWDMPEAGGTLTIKADDTPFFDGVVIEFTDERTFYITLNELVYQFVKL